MTDDLASVGCATQGSATQGSATAGKRGRPREKPSAAGLEVSSSPPGRLVSGTVPYRILARILKLGPMTYHDVSAYISGSRMIRRDKYIDPALQGLRRRGYIDLSRAVGCKGRWMITQAGRLAMRRALPNPADVQKLRVAEAERIRVLRLEHVERQRRAGIPEALIHAPFGGSLTTTAGV